MKSILNLLKGIAEMLKGVVLNWFPVLKDTIHRLWIIIQGLIKRHHAPHGDKNATNIKCAPIHHPSFHRPDPLIYSQSYLSKLGLAVTWDNPDIRLFQNGMPVTESALLPDTDYEIEATIWNNSYNAPISGLKIDFAFLSFGAGTLLNFIGSKIVNLGVKGGSNHPALARILWHTPNTIGHYCIQVSFKWIDDLNPENNMGQNNVDIVSPQSPAEFAFMLHNNTRTKQQYHFYVDTYVLPGLAECQLPKIKRQSNDVKWKQIQSIHNSDLFPIPPGWFVILNPAEPVLDSNASEEIKVQITPPDHFLGQVPFNVNAMNQYGKAMGGVTLYVSKS